MDPLSQIIGLLRPRALMWAGVEGLGQWGLAVPASDRPTFCLVVSGDCWFARKGTEPVRLCAGDMALATAAPSFSILSHQDAKATSVVLTAGEVRVGDIGGTATDGDWHPTRLVGGFFQIDSTNAPHLLNFLPQMVLIRQASQRHLKSIVDAIADEAGSKEPGRELVLARLLEILLVLMFRHASVNGEIPLQGMLGGLADQAVSSAIYAIHTDVRRRWTISQLAQIAGVSRSVFARRFSAVVGTPPNKYLTEWRMALAKEALNNGDALSTIATSIGYGSVSALSTAFTRETGFTPRMFRKPQS